LGNHVSQKGSLVAPDRLRFDISHPKPISDFELEQVETIANEMILQNGPVETRIMAVDDAIQAGAMALFGEKYGDEVRVVTMGTEIHGNNKGKPFSVELCGGTHVTYTGDIGLVTIMSESAVSSGVRRIEAMTGDAARLHLEDQQKCLKQIASVLKVPPSKTVDRVNSLVAERRVLERELADIRKKLAMTSNGDSGNSVKILSTPNGDVSYFARIVENVQPRELKGLVDEAKTQLGSGIVAIGSVTADGKAGIVVGVTDDLVKRFNAVDLVRIASGAVGGKGGGGRADMAQAGGPNGANASAALAALETEICQ